MQEFPNQNPYRPQSGSGEAPPSAPAGKNLNSPVESNIYDGAGREVPPPPPASASGSMSEAAYSGSLQYILSQFVGEYCVVDFLFGTNVMVRREGFLYQVGSGYILLYQNGVYMVCDLYSIKYVAFTSPQNRTALSASRGSKRTGL